MARSPKLPKVKRGDMRYVMVTDKRDGKQYKTLTSVMPGTGFPVICEIPSNLHRKGEKGGRLLTHDKIVKGEIHATPEHFIEGFKKLKKLEHSQGLKPEEQTRYYEATMNEITASMTLEAKARRKTKTTVTIATATGIVPEIIAAQVADKVFQTTPSLLTKVKSLLAYLSSKAEAIYRTDSGFAKTLQNPDTGRAALQQQMETWAADYVNKNTKETTAMTSISNLLASSTPKKTPPPAPQNKVVDTLITAKTTVHKSGVKKKAPGKVAAAPPSKSMSGLQIKLDALAKKYPGVTFEIQTLKTKKNQIKVSGLGKMQQKDMFALFKKIPNTHHIPNKMAPGIAYFTLFGKKEITASETQEAPGKSQGAVASSLSAPVTTQASAIDSLTASIADDKFARLKKDDVVYIRSLNKPTHRVEPIEWNSKAGHVVKASFMGHDNKGNLRLFCQTGLGTAAGQGPVSVPKEWASLEYNVTASILLNPSVGDTGVVYRDPDSTDSEFAASDHEGLGVPLKATVKEIKGQRLRLDIESADKSQSYRNAWVFATHLYKTPETDDATPATMTAELDADMIDGYVMQHIATEVRSGREPQTYVDKIRTTIKNVDPEDVDEALARLDNDGIISIKGKNIYPSSDLMEVYASTLAQRTAIETAKKAMKDAQEAHRKNPNPMNRKRLDTAKRVYAKHLKNKKASVAFVEKGPPKAKRTAAGTQVAV